MGRHADPVYYLMRTEEVLHHLEFRHVPLGEVAEHLGISKGYWSQILHRHKPVSERVRMGLLDSGYFRGLTELDLWERVERGEP